MQNSLKQTFNNAQLELLKVFSHNLPENELIALKKLIANFFAEKLVNQADKKWEEMSWSDANMDQMLEQKLRKSKI